MSRGIGAVQRRVLDEMARLGRTDTFELAAAVFDVNPSADGMRHLSAAQLGSVRHAVRQLEKLGFVGRIERLSRRSRQKISSMTEQARFVEAIRSIARRRGLSEDSMTIVRSHYRYKRPPRKRKPVAPIEGPVIVHAADPAKARKRLRLPSVGKPKPQARHPRLN
jgi:hypothetical protein